VHNTTVRPDEHSSALPATQTLSMHATSQMTESQIVRTTGAD